MTGLRGRWPGPLLAVMLALCSSPSFADTPRDLITRAAFADRDKATALAHVTQARQAALATLAHNPGDTDAATTQAIALGYQAKLTGSRSEALAARRAFETLVARRPGDPEAQAALGGWHIGAVYKLGSFMARAALGAQKSTGLAALDKSVALAGDRALFAGLAGLLRLELDPQDRAARTLLEKAAAGATPTPLDRIMKRAAATTLVPLRAGNTAGAQALAVRSLPFGWADGR